MNAIDNKRLMQDVFSEMSEGNLEPFIEAMAEEMQWTWMGTGQWSHTFDGKESVVNELLAAVKETLSPPFEVLLIASSLREIMWSSSTADETPLLMEGPTITNTAGYVVCRWQAARAARVHGYGTGHANIWQG